MSYEIERTVDQVVVNLADLDVAPCDPDHVLRWLIGLDKLITVKLWMVWYACPVRTDVSWGWLTCPTLELDNPVAEHWLRLWIVLELSTEGVCRVATLGITKIPGAHLVWHDAHDALHGKDVVRVEVDVWNIGIIGIDEVPSDYPTTDLAALVDVRTMADTVAFHVAGCDPVLDVCRTERTADDVKRGRNGLLCFVVDCGLLFWFKEGDSYRLPAG